MPPVIGAAILAGVGADSIAIGAGTLATSTIFGISTASIVGEVALVGALAGAEYLFNATQKVASQQATVNQALAPRSRIYGRAFVGGVRAFFDSRNNNLYQIIVIATDRIDAFEEFYIGDTGVGVTLSQVTSPPWSGYIAIEQFLGDDSQPPSAVISGAYPEWPATNILGGIAYVAILMKGVKQDDFPKVYPQSYNTQFRFVVRGARVCDFTAGQDPNNKATWTWSESPALCIADYLTHKDGMRLPFSMLDTASFADFHGTCMEQVPLKSGGTEDRYRIGGTYDFSELPKDVLRRMCDVCDGQLYQGPSGKIGIRGGKWHPPTFTVSSQNTLAAGWQQGAGAFDAYNRLTASFPYGYNDDHSGFAFFSMTDIAPRDDLASQALVGVIPQAMQLPMCPSFRQAARLAKIAMAKANPLWKGQITTNASSLDLIGEQTTNVEYTPPGAASPLVSGTFLVSSLSIAGDLSTCDVGVSYLTADAYAWDPATEEPEPPPTPQQIAYVNNVPAPTGVSFVTSLQTISGGTQGLVGKLSWSPPTRTDAVAVAQYQVSGSGVWQPMTLSADGLSATTPLLQDGTSYDAEVQFVAGASSSTWTVVANVTAQVPPSPPASVSASLSGTTVSIVVLSPGSSNLYSVAVYRTTVNSFSTSHQVGGDVVTPPNYYTTVSDTLTTHGTYYYWAVSRTSAGATSAPIGPSPITY